MRTSAIRRWLPLAVAVYGAAFDRLPFAGRQKAARSASAVARVSIEKLRFAGKLCLKLLLLLRDRRHLSLNNSFQVLNRAMFFQKLIE